jgi:hypothetical protein
MNSTTSKSERIAAFDDIEARLNRVISTLISNAKNETAEYYDANPGSYEIYKSTEMILSYLKAYRGTTNRNKMKKTLQDQYLLIKEGKGHKGVFLTEAKRQFPDLIPNNADVKLTAQILKDKNIINENISWFTVN